MIPFFITVPHAGEQIPKTVTWLQGLPEELVMCDVDRYVDELYQPVATKEVIPFLVTPWHRYVVDPNRLTTDIDQGSVISATAKKGEHPIGLHWWRTTTEKTLMPGPMSEELHQQLVRDYYQPFHDKIAAQFTEFKQSGHEQVFHLDAHSMPSVGTATHRDPGETRAEIVISDQDGKSCDPQFLAIVVAAYEEAGFAVKTNWPYKGGGVTQRYGQPNLGQHTLQVELSRAMYMDENSKQKKPELFAQTQTQLIKAVTLVKQQLSAKGLV